MSDHDFSSETANGGFEERGFPISERRESLRQEARVGGDQGAFPETGSTTRARNGNGSRCKLTLSPSELAELELQIVKLGMTFDLAAIAAWVATLGHYLGRSAIKIAIVNGQEEQGPAWRNLDFRRNPTLLELAQLSDLLQKEGAGRPDSWTVADTKDPALRITFGAWRLSSPNSLPSVDADVSLWFHEKDELGQAYEVQARPDLFDRWMVQRLSRSFAGVLNLWCSPHRILQDLDFFLPSERQQLLFEWNDTETEEIEVCLDELLTDQAGRRPDAVALAEVIGKEERFFSYREVEHQANILAKKLTAVGVGPESRVGVSSRRSAEMIWALVGVLKAGGAYVALDPNYPKKRIERIASDSQRGVESPVVVRQPGLPEELPADVLLKSKLVWLEPAGERSTPQLRQRVRHSESLAYVLYTSGSSGKPKGVAITHHSAVALVRWAREAFSAAELSGVLAATSINFDLSVFEIFVPLAWGGRVVLVENALALAEPRGAHREVRLINTVPSAVDELLHASELPESVITVNLAGEALRRELVSSLYQHFADRKMKLGRVLDLYGPSEDTTYSTWKVRRPEGPETIGRPIAGTRSQVVDERLRLLPQGSAGELCLGGLGLARGYLHQGAMTAERFVPDDFAAIPGGRLYRTGDRVRLSSTGELVFLGRLDQQVKVRGFRIELGEIEAQLMRHVAVTEAAVAVLGSGTDVRLLAYAVVVEGTEIDEDRLRRDLKNVLPAYMIPSHFMIMEALPRLPNGKIDRRALPEPAAERPSLQTEYVVPSTELEHRLAALWGEMLGISKVGVEDDFLELGGHSLLLGRLAARLRVDFGVSPRLSDLVHQRTILRLAEWISAQLEGRGETVSRFIPQVSRSIELPLSFPQERIWFIDQLAPGNIAYNTQATIRFRGRCEINVLQRVLFEIVCRHEIFRTSFPVVAGRPVQVIHEAPAIELPEVDMSGLEAQAKEREAERLMKLWFCRPYDLLKIPLARWVVLRMASDDHLLLQSEHHFVHDGWSLALLLSEVELLYPVFATGRKPVLAPPPIQFADYAYWQRQWMQGEVLEEFLDHWVGMLGDCAFSLELPTDRPRPKAHSFRGAMVRLFLEPELCQKLRDFRRREGVTLFATMMAGFKSILYRYSAEDDVVVGTAVANRSQHQMEKMIGMVVNTIVLRTIAAGQPSFGDLVRRVQKTSWEALRYPEMPLDKLVERLVPERDLARNPLFQTMFSFHDSPVPDLSFDGIEAEAVIRHNGSAKMDLNIIVIPRAEQRVGRQPQDGGDSIEMLWEYSSDLFDRSTIERMVGHYLTFLAAAISDPVQTLMELPLLSAAETAEILVLGSPGQRDSLRDLAVDVEIARQAEMQPEAIALVSASSQQTYGQLLARSDRLRQALHGRGLGAEERVAIYLERGPDLIAAALAVMRAGCCYVPLDPSWPPARIVTLLEDSGTSAVLTQASLADELPSGLAQLRVDAPLAAGSDTSAVAGSDRRAVESLAYVVYTSGSTGMPKGVAVSHGGLANLVCWHQAFYGLSAKDRATFVAGLGFDAAVWEIWPYLSTGARLHIPSEEERVDPFRLAEFLIDQEITLAFAPTPMAEQLLRMPWPSTTRLRALLTGGDKLHVYPSSDLPFTLLNHYGPTENTVVATFSAVPLERPSWEIAPSIGRPIANVGAYVVDPRQHLLPIGIPGELGLGGDSLARGYLQRPGWTAERFIPDAWSGQSGKRLYRTGDRTRFRQAGQLEFLGRLDAQVKIRGFRIELGEIEAALLAVPGITEAVVIVQEDDAENRRLLGYFCAGEDPSMTEIEARHALEARLPGTMVPSVLIRLDRLPLTPNGKVDRRALPMPREDERTAFTGPRNPLEEILAGILSDLLDRREIGIDEDFFVLGGHSLLATQAIARIRSHFRVELPLQRFFEQPTVVGTASAILELTGAEPSVSVPPLTPQPAQSPRVLSFAQERLWFLDRLLSNRTAYNVTALFRLEGAIEVGALAEAFRLAQARHAVLRTTFQAEGGRPRPKIHDASHPLLQVDLSGLPRAQAEELGPKITEQLSQRPFDLEQDILFRPILWRVEGETYLLTLQLHHIVTDGWSQELLLRELSLLYEALLRGDEALPVPALKVQYSDFAAWQRQWLQGEILDQQMGFWKDQLVDAPALLELPTDRPRPAVQGYRGARWTTSLAQDELAALHRLAGEQGVTLFMLLLASWQTLLSRHSRQIDINVGTPVAGRRYLEIEPLIGFFVNTLVLRSHIQPKASFEALVNQIRERVLAAFAHQDLPFEKLVEELQPERSLSHAPLFQVMFALQNAPAASLSLPGAVTRTVPLKLKNAKFDLTLTCREDADGLQMVWDYDRDLFDLTTVVRLGERWKILLSALPIVADQRIESLPLLSSSERQQTLIEWNDREVAVSGESTAALIAVQVELAPERVAVVHGASDHWSYGALDRYANQLSRVLHRRGVVSGVGVGISLERSFEMLGALCAVQRAGGWYLPIDPGLPQERARFMIEDSQVRWIVTSEDLASELPTSGLMPILLDAEQAEIDEQSTVSLSLRRHREQAVYALYTSGSTGRPKGVQVSDGALLSFLQSMRQAPGLATHDTLVAVTTLSFDISGLELYLPLLAGSRLVIASSQEASDGQLLHDLLGSQRATVMQATPATWRLLLAVGWPEKRALKVICGGEVMTEGLRDELVKHSASVWNVYGPTETTIWSSALRLAASDGPVELGGPIDNTQLWVIDQGGQPVGIGAPGELVIGGRGLATGYLGRGGLTATRFIPDGWSGAFGARAYRTGDLVQAQGEGHLMFLGRLDHQVKVRGFRIELGEIEATLAQHPAVSVAAVTTWQAGPGDLRLAAYVVLRAIGQAGVDELRVHLGESLPEYMVPSHWMFLEKMPLTASGKVDRKALLAPVQASEERTASRRGWTPAEELVAGLWGQLLGTEPRSLDDSFFALGGHSLLVTQLMARLRQTFGVELPLAALFEQPTLQAFARVLTQTLSGTPQRILPAITPVSREKPLPLSFAQEQLWVLDQLLERRDTYNIPVGLELVGELDVAALRQSLTDVARRHEILRTTYEVVEGRPVQIIQEPGVIPVAQIDLSAIRGAQRIAKDLQYVEEGRVFDLACGPVLRGLLIRLGVREHRLFLTLHHIAGDGWSTEVLLREWVNGYRARIEGHVSTPSALPIQYADYAAWQRRWLQGDVLAELVGFWRDQLRGAPDLLELPTDRPRTSVRGRRGYRLRVPVAPHLTVALRKLARREEVTPYMLLLAAFKVLLFRYSGQQDVSVGTPIAGRRHLETEGLIGFFVNTLVLRSENRGWRTFKDLLSQLRQRLLSAFSHQDLPFEKLVEELQPERNQTSTPLVQVVFVLHKTPFAQLAKALPKLELKPIFAVSETTKFDLTLGMIETPDGLACAWEFDRHLFDRTTIERLHGQLVAFLSALTTTGEVSWDDPPLLSMSERHQLQYEWNDSSRSYPVSTSVAGLFMEQVAQSCAAIALTQFQDGSHLSYGELDRRSSALGSGLRSLGVGLESLVGLYQERSLASVVAILGTFKAGGAYVPLDVDYPAERLRFMMSDTACEVVITDSAASVALPSSLQDSRQLELDRGGRLLGGFPRGFAAVESGSDHLAYVMYTSGSTGRPKGVAVTHRNIVRLVCGSDYVGFSSQEVGLLFAPLAFDATTFELWFSLLHGGRLVVYPSGPASLSELGGVLLSERVRTLWLTSGLFHQMVEDHLSSLRTVHQLLAGGDVLRPEAVRQALSGIPGLTLINGYGPTETTTFATCHGMRSVSDVGAPVSIGRGIANARLHVLGRDLGAQPLGVIGELYIGGTGVSRGYLGRPGLTSERFLPEIVGGDPGDRMYRTGDQVRWSSDQRLEFLGRRDDQVKLRGFRVELGEIEAALLAEADVSAAVAMVRRFKSGDSEDARLLAWVVLRTPSSSSGSTGSRLREALSGKLPSYMVPSVVLEVAELPLGATGKVDRRALPDPDESGLSSVEHQAARTLVERDLAEIWSSLLGVAQVGREDDFFELGGHSLLATRVVSQIRKHFAVELELHVLFENPTLASLAQAIESGLSEGEGEGAASLLPAIESTPREGDLAASFAQERMWFLDNLLSEKQGYNVPWPLCLKGELDVAALAWSLEEVERRHEVLRTSYKESDGLPRQVIHEPSQVALPVVDLQGLATAVQEAARSREREQLRVFDLERGPVWRALLLRLSRREHHLLLTAHHIACDGWSMGLWLRELNALYEAARNGLPSPLPALGVQYADYAQWQRQWLSGERLAAEVDYWRDQLHGVPALLELPTDRPRPIVQSYAGGNVYRLLSAVQLADLQGLSQSRNSTLYMTLLTAWAALLERLSGQQDLSLGFPIFGRRHAELEDLIGFFVNTLVLRTTFTELSSFGELLAQVRTKAMAAFAHQDVPFEKLVKELQPERSLGHTPLFQVAFALQNVPMETPRMGPLELSLLQQVSPAAKFDLYLACIEADEGLRCELSYNSDLFDRTTVQRWLEQWSVLLQGVITMADERLETLDLLLPHARHQLLYEWNDSSSSFPTSASVADLFMEQAARSSEAIALTQSQEGSHLSYGELDRRSSALGSALQSLGVGLESFVGLYQERSLASVTAILGTFKAGGAYVPLDVDYPVERLRFMMSDTGCKVVITADSAASEALSSSLQDCRQLRLDRGGRLLERFPTGFTAVESGSDHLAYVMYTSGSTGRPKGVAATHRNIVRLVFGSDYVELSSQQVSMLFAPLAFDASTFELWFPLLHGGRLVVYPSGPTSLAELSGVVLSERLRTLWLTSGLFRQIVEEHLGSLRTVDHLMTGGEVMSPDAARQALSGIPGVTLTNAYGPTETTTFTTCHRMRSESDARAPVSIGREIANARLYVLARDLGTQPLGVIGELYIGGIGVARGYLGRPGLTAERFLPEIEGGDPGDRMYRTGDQVRWLSDKRLEFIGRQDDQVKLRGFRVELGEIEAALLAETEVSAAVAMVRRYKSGASEDARLLAWVVLRTPSSSSGAVGVRLREALSGKLPSYMVPNAVLEIAELPLAATGKLDRRALPDPDEHGPSSVAHQAPRTLVERDLAEIWSSLLGVMQVGREDDFFELGGHSLLATRVASQIRKHFAVELALHVLFENPMLASLAQAIESGLGEGDASLLPAIVVGPREGDLAASFAQERMWFLDKLLNEKQGYNVPWPLFLKGELDVAALAWSLAEVERRHEVLRTTYREWDGLPRQVIHAPSRVTLPVVDLQGLATADQEAARLREREQLRVFDLERGPVWRALLLRLSRREHHLLLTAHHIACDGWSMGVWLRELNALYEAARNGLPSPLPALGAQYADYARWQRQWLSSERLATEVAYWRDQLHGAPALLELPTDHPRPSVQSYAGGSLYRLLSAARLADLQRLSQSRNSTLYMTLLATWATLLKRLSGQEDLSLGFPIFGRRHVELEDLIGFFVNTLVLRTTFTEVSTFGELLAQVRAKAMAAFAHQDVPFEKLVEELQPERSLGHAPLFQVALALQNVPVETPRLGPLELGHLPLSSLPAKFDLFLTCHEAAEGLRCELSYNSDLFDRTTVLRWLEQWSVLLERVITLADERFETLNLLLSPARHQLLYEWNNTRTAELEELGDSLASLPALVTAQAARTPDSAAIAFPSLAGEERVSYRELGCRAAALASRLQTLGAGPESRVGVCMGRSPSMVCALLGVLQAGAAYVALDPAYPEERLQMIFEDAQHGVDTPVIISEKRWREHLPATSIARSHTIWLDDWPRSAADNSSSAGESFPQGKNLAYVLYTSGSTGRPKGVAISHRSAVALVSWAQRVYGSSELSGALASTSINFDLSVFELFVPLSAGGTVILVENALALAEPGLAGAFHAVRLLNTVPSVASELLRLAALPSGLQTVNLAGEPLRGSLVAELYGHPGVTRVLDLYGPSEDTTYSTWSWREGNGAETIGRPVDGTQAYVCDRALQQPVATGVIGELCLAGEGLARGYLLRPAATAERFVPHPWSARLGERLYRTGDRARQMADGRIELLGRFDHQVKVRGFRIELGEVESQLLAHPKIAAATALVMGTGSTAQIAAFAVASGEPPVSQELEAHLRASLPGYMVPGILRICAELPRLPNGKVDRRALIEQLAESALRGELPHIEPRNPVEEILVSIWSEILDRDEVGIYDNFFDLGGHSLLATRVLSQIRSLLGAELPLRVLFEQPTISRLADQVSRYRGAEAQAFSPIAATLADEADLEPSFAQERMWFLDQLSSDKATYNLPWPVRLHGSLDVPALAHALELTVHRHESLRTRFPSHKGRPCQLIEEPAQVPLPLVDLSGLQAEDVDQVAERLLVEEVGRPFDLARGPLVRNLLLRLRADEHHLLLTLHHIISDGWSMDVLWRDLSVFYRRAGEALPELSLQYAAFAAWQRQLLTGAVVEQQIDFWQRQLAGAPNLISLPTDRPRPPVLSQRGQEAVLAVDAETTRRILARCREEGVTPFMFLLSALKLLLARYAEQTDVSVGTPVAGRQHVETEELIGLFVNTLVLRSQPKGRKGFRQYLQQLRDITLDAFAYQMLPFERLVEELQPERDLSYAPLFQVLFVMQSSPTSVPVLPGPVASLLPIPIKTAKYDLSFHSNQMPSGLTLQVTYSSDLFDAATAQRLLRHWRQALAVLAAHPEQELAAVPLLSLAEQHALQWEWNDSQVTFAGPSLPERIAAQAARAPEAIAVVFRDRYLSYRQLDVEARKLAGVLMRHGVGPEALVAVLAERSLELPVGLMAILFAGGAYVPIDPTLPAERLAYLLSDALGGCEHAVVLSQSDLVELLPREQTLVVELLDEQADWRSEDATVVFPPITPQSLAYLIYTSGSTGQPKGAMNTHGGILNRLLWGQETYPLASDDGLLQKTLFSFDVSVFEFFWPLLAGARLVMAEPEGHREGAYLARTIVEQRITALHFVPVMLQTVLSEAILSEARGLRWVFSGGEALSQEIQEEFFSRQGERQVELHQYYGPAEAAVDVTYSRCEPGRRAVLGGPVSNTRLALYGRHQEAVPIGVSGELHLRGIQVSRGYWRRPGLTARSFVPDVLAEEPGARIYRTGDRARWLGDGRLEYMGRIDHQVKIRGIRVELGEIEAALERYSGVSAVAVVIWRPQPQQVRLVAYLQVDEQASFREEELRQHLRESLPAYMVPARWVYLAEMPLTPSGKIDRKALPEPQALPADQAALVAPRTRIEILLAAIWSEVLGLSLVGLKDNFFDLGGHSLDAIRLTYRLQEFLGLSLEVRTVFEAQILEDLAVKVEEMLLQQLEELAEDAALQELEAAGAAVATRGMNPVSLADQDSIHIPKRLSSRLHGLSWIKLELRSLWLRRASEQGAGSEVIARREDRSVAPLSWMQEAFWLIEHQEKTDLSVYCSSRVINFDGFLDIAALTASVASMVERHEILRTRFDSDDEGQTYQEVCDLTMPLPEIDLAGLHTADRDDERKRILQIKSQQSFDLRKAPVWRLVLIRRSDRQTSLLVTMHHIINDQWSIDGVFFPELEQCYRSWREVEKPVLPELSTQFGDYAQWERDRLQGQVLDGYLDYWGGKLQGGIPQMHLRTDRPRPEKPRFRGAVLRFAFSKELTEALELQSRQQDVSLYMTLLAGYKLLLAHFSDQDDVLVGSPSANRFRLQTENMLGCFANMLLLRTDTGGDPTLEEVLARVRETALGAFSHQEMPFMLLLANFPPPDFAFDRAPFQAMFTYLNAVRQDQSQDGAETFTEREAIDRDATDQDVALWLTRGEDGLHGIFVYDTDLFDASTAESMITKYTALLGELALNLDKRLSQLGSTCKFEEALRLGSTGPEK